MKKELIGNLVLPDRILYGGVIEFENGIITDIRPGNNGLNKLSLPYILPGLVDIHNHGAMGFDYMDATPEAFVTISRYLVSCGVTTALCTTVSASVDDILSLLNFYRKWSEEIYDCKKHCRFCGVHLEGPYISPENRGAHSLNYLLKPSDGYSWIMDNSDIIKEVTVAPELEGMSEMIARLSEAGITVSGGHDKSEIENVISAVENGMSHCTHIYCAMSTLHKSGIERKCGLCEYAMTHSEITAEMIADNHHIPPLLAKMIYNCKGADKLCIVSDAIAPTGLPESDEICTLGVGDNATQVLVENGVALVADKSCYAGSVQSLNRMIVNLVRDCNIPLVDAVRMATLTPSNVIGINNECGSLKVGKRADFCIMDSELNVLQTIISGEIVYKTEKPFQL